MITSNINNKNVRQQNKHECSTQKQNVNNLNNSINNKCENINKNIINLSKKITAADFYDDETVAESLYLIDYTPASKKF